MHTKEETLAAFSRLLDIQEELRVKCPWDKKQTNLSLRPHTIEEAHELCDAIMEDNPVEIQKEMGDVMEHLIFYAMIGKEQGRFDMCDVLNKECDKLIFRHPHIYGQAKAANPEEVSKLWEQTKQKEKDANKTTLSGVPRSLPSLIKAYRIQDKARNVGFDWENPDDVWQKVFEEIDELKAELQSGNKEKATKELGDVLFSIANAARLYHINPDTALEETNRKFITRFEYIENKAKQAGRYIKDLTLGEMDKLWNEAKRIAPVAIATLAAATTMFTSCNMGNTRKETVDALADSIAPEIPDTAVYGRVGEATAMHTLQIVTDDGKTLTFALDQNLQADVQGGLFAGDYVTLTATKTSFADEPEVQKLINITSLLGKYTSLDRNFEIKADGTVDSPNIAAESQPYTQWKTVNTRLVLNTDTFDIMQLGPDSLILESAKGIYVYKRK